MQIPPFSSASHKPPVASGDEAQMPPGIPVASGGLDRGENAGILAVQILSMADKSLEEKMMKYRSILADKVVADSEEVC